MKEYCQCCSKQFVDMVCDRKTTVSKRYAVRLVKEYIEKVNLVYKANNATEHSYRGYLQTLIAEMVSDITITNEPKRQKCGAPDYIIQKKEIPVGYIECKDIGEDIHNLKKTDLEQRERYISSLPNIIFTDYLEFIFFRNAQIVHRYCNRKKSNKE